MGHNDKANHPGRTMSNSRLTKLLSTLGLIALAILAVVLSALALRQPTVAGSVGPASPAATTGSSATSPVAATTSSAATTGAATTGATAPTLMTPSAVDETPSATSVVIIGDENSVRDDAPTWVDAAAAALGWTDVTNLSSPGRGYLALPSTCSFDPCGTFEQSLPGIIESDPDVVITFGGTSDGDVSLDEAIPSYYKSLRDALPDAQIVGVSPVLASDESDAPYWLTLHRRNISAAMTSVDGVFVDAGQPGLGEGETLSAAAQQGIADAVIEALS